jgi:putative isomerase
MLGTGDDVTSSDKFYHWGALLGYVQYLEMNRDSR